MKPFTRADRVGGQIQKNLSAILRKEIKDPRLAHVTITGVKMTRDLRLARIYFVIESTRSSDKQVREEAVQGFASARGYIKRTLAQMLGLRYMPDLTFFYDESFDYGARIDSVLNALKKENGSNNTTN